MPEIKKPNRYKNLSKTAICASCGKRFSIPYSSGTINCPDCSKNKGSSLERPYTRDTVFLVCKWYSEGMTVKKIASLLSRSEENIRKALEIGGVFDVTQEGGTKL